MVVYGYVKISDHRLELLRKEKAVGAFALLIHRSLQSLRGVRA
jgi:hypothetical protein